MGKARYRALTHMEDAFLIFFIIRRNGKSPIQGIDTNMLQSHQEIFLQ